MERAIKVGGVLVSITVGWMVLTAAMEAIDLRVTTIEKYGSPPLQRQMREMQDSLRSVQKEQSVSRYLQCRAPENRADSFCADVVRPR